MQYFVVRHIDTGHILPRLKRPSHWDPETLIEGPPRLFATRGAAIIWCKIWARGVGYRADFTPDNAHLYRAGADIAYSKDEKRKITDLEIVPVTFNYGDPV